MGWNAVVETGKVYGTPHGEGRVEQVSESGNARVNVDGQRYEVPVDQLTEPGQPAEHEYKVGDYVRIPSRGNELRRIDEEKYGKFRSTQILANGKDGTEYTSFRPAKDFVPAEAPNKEEKAVPENETQFEVGDKIRVKSSDETGVVTKVTQRLVYAEVDDAGEADRSWSKKGAHNFLEKLEGKPVEEDSPDKADQVKTTGDGMHELFRLKEYLENKIEGEVDKELMELRALAKSSHTLEVKIGDKANKVEGLKHKQLEQLINYAALRLSPLLVGMAGTGKTHAGEQTAKALGLDFYAMSVGAQTSKSDIIGYMAANGDYVKTHFRDAYEKGGVFLMDEIDAGNANVLIQINAALSNGLCAFPDKMVARHEDFVFIASANTFGNGANRQYVGRNQLDAATLDRFAIIEWFIDDELESNLTTGINGKAWYMAVRAARDYVAEKNIRALVSPRATQKGSKLLHVGQDLNEVIHATILGSVPDDKKADVTEVATTVFNKFASDVPSKLPKAVNPVVSDLFKDSPF